MSTTFPILSFNVTKSESQREKNYKIVIEEKVSCLSYELVPETLPSVRIKLRNNLAHDAV